MADALTDELYSERFLVRRPLLAAVAPTARAAPGAAHRRDRPGRRRVRGVPARDPGRLLGHRARAGHVPGRDAAGGGDHVEPHPRRARRPQAPLPLPLGRAPRLRARGAHRDGARPGGGRAAGPPGGGGHRGVPGHRAVQAAGGGRDDRLGPGPGPAGAHRAGRAVGGRHAGHRAQVPRGPGARPPAAGSAELVDAAALAPGRAGERPATRAAWSGSCGPCAARGWPCRWAATIVFAQAAAAVGAAPIAGRCTGRGGPPWSPVPRTWPSTTGCSPPSGTAGPAARRPTSARRGHPADRRRAARRRRRRPSPTSPTTPSREVHHRALQPPRGAAPQGLRRLHARRAGRGPAADGRPPPGRVAAPQPPPSPVDGAAGAGPTCAAPCAGPCAPAARPARLHHLEPQANARAGWCCCAT